MALFELNADYQPAGDQPEVIKVQAWKLNI